MSDTMAQAAGVPVEAYDTEWNVLTMGDLARIQNKIEIPEEMRPFISLFDLVRFIKSPQGLEVVWPFIAKKDTNVNDFSILDRVNIATTVINYSLGITPKEANEEEKKEKLASVTVNVSGEIGQKKQPD